ncbi:MAG: endonuclease/exonuclease/phosphatase family protein [Anaerolineales bacterium]|jgi:endonuclease/exonuclease/phosphatase family metal-dependent hydrolase
MEKAQSGNNLHLREVVLYSIMFLFFFQLISDFVEAVYVFGLLGTGIPPEIVSLLFFFSPVIFFGMKRKIPRWILLLSGWLMLLCRVVEVMLDTREKMLVSGLGVAAFLVFFPACLGIQSSDEVKDVGRKLGTGLIFSLALSILFRALQSGFDITEVGMIKCIGWVLALGAAVLLWRHGRFEGGNSTLESGVGSRGKVILFSCSLAAVLLLLYFAFTSPNVIARWTGANYLLVLGLALFSLCLFAWLWFAGKLSSLNRSFIAIVNLVFVISMLLTILPYQIGFPDTPGGYPLWEAAISPLSSIPLILMLLTFPISLVNFVLYSHEIVEERPTPRRLGLGFTIASLFTMLMILAHVFTTVYDYIPVVGPFFRDKFWLVYLVVGVMAAAPVLSVQKDRLAGFGKAHKDSIMLRVVVVVLALTAISGAYLISAKPVHRTIDLTSLRVFTYNIQQGYSEDGIKNYQGQLALIKSRDPDILGLQESDTNRIAGGNADIVRYFADNLDMYSYYGPSTVTGTFGIALLSKYPIEDARTFYMYSEGEQTATIEAKISIGEVAYTIYVTHLGNGGPIIQQAQILETMEGKENIIAMGDYNFRPDTEQYQMTVDELDDAYLKSQTKIDSEVFDPFDRIDHIFVSPEVLVSEVEYILSPASDHPAMFAVIYLPVD